VDLNCSFLPDHDCKFEWARFGVELSAFSKAEKQASIKPIAWSMSPEDILSEIKVKRDHYAGIKAKFGRRSWSKWKRGHKPGIYCL
jgi:hypothetical protein